METRKHQRAGLVNRADHRGFALARDVIEQRDDCGGGGGVQTRRGLVEDDDARALDERDGEREAPSLAAGQTLEEEAAGAGVLARGEAGDGEGVRSPPIRALRVERRSEELKRKLEVLPWRHGGHRLSSRGTYGLLDEHAPAHLVPVQGDVPRGRARSFAVGEGVEEDGLAGAGRADDGEHLARVNRRGGVDEHALIRGTLLPGDGSRRCP